jgi:hypothetical protein
METTRRDLVELWKMMNEYRKLKGVKFAHFLVKNKKKIQPEIEALEEAIEMSEAYRAYDNERAKLAEHYCDKDEHGRSIISNSQYVITEKFNEFNKELETLKEKFSNVIKEREQQIKEYNELLDEKVEYEGFKIHLDNIPNDVDSDFVEVLMNTQLLDDPTE